MEPLPPSEGPQTPEPEIKVQAIPNGWHLWRWRPKDKKSFLIGFGFLALAFVMLMSHLDVNQQREAARTQGQKPNPATAAPTNPTPAQIQQWQQNLKTAEQQYQAEQQYAAAQQALLNGTAANAANGGGKPLTLADLNAAQSPGNAAGSNGAGMGGAQPAYGTTGSNAAGADPLKEQQKQLAYKSLFSDNVVRQERSQPVSFHPAQTAPGKPDAEPPATEESPERTMPAQTAPEKSRKALDFDPSKHQTYWLPEGTIIEAELVNRLDGEQPGPVLAQVSANVYLEGTKLLLLPKGAKMIGSASKVNAFGQQRLAVAFHRTLVPGLRQYSIPMEKESPGLSQAGETGLHDKVNSHYASIFGASLAVGAIGGLAQIGNGQIGFGYDPGVQFRNGVSQSTAQAADRILDRFLNRMPTIVIREGTRVRIILTDDWEIPAYDDMMQEGWR